jgi:hypothetical protein
LIAVAGKGNGAVGRHFFSSIFGVDRRIFLQRRVIALVAAFAGVVHRCARLRLQ